MACVRCGAPPADVKALAECLTRVSQLAVRFARIAECDLNPVMVYAEGLGVRALRPSGSITDMGRANLIVFKGSTTWQTHRSPTRLVILRASSASSPSDAVKRRSALAASRSLNPERGRGSQIIGRTTCGMATEKEPLGQKLERLFFPDRKIKKALLLPDEQDAALIQLAAREAVTGRRATARNVGSRARPVPAQAAETGPPPASAGGGPSSPLHPQHGPRPPLCGP